MVTERVTQVLGFIALLGGIVRIGMTPSALIWGLDSMPELIVGLTACLLMGIGVFGIHLHQAERTGMLGLISVILISASSTLTAALVWSSMLRVTAESNDIVGIMQSVNSLMMLVGMILFAIATIRARIYPIYAVVLFLLFPIATFIPVVTYYSTVLWGVSFIVFGWYAMKDKAAGRTQTYREAA